MVGGGLFVVAAAVVAAAMASGLNVGGGIQRVLTLERASPVRERVELEAIRARDHARHARMLQSFSGGIVDFPVGGSSDPYAVGLYYTKVRLGSPPREFSVQIDTGSDILWVACSSCNDCPQNSGLGIPLNFFNATASSTVAPISCSDNICASMVQLASAECTTESNNCGFSFQYGDGSGTSGFYASDVLYFDTISGTSLMANSSASVVFGACPRVSVARRQPMVNDAVASRSPSPPSLASVRRAAAAARAHRDPVAATASPLPLRRRSRRESIAKPATPPLLLAPSRNPRRRCCS